MKIDKENLTLQKNKMSNRFANIRKDYLKNTLDEKQIHNDPLVQFHNWMSDAINMCVSDPTAMVISTVSEKGFPSSRMVLLKDADTNGFVFFTNYNSRKGKHLLKNPNASLLFFWKELERQVRIEGNIIKTEASESNAYFYSRPLESQISAIISPQSEKIADRNFLEQAMKDFVNSKKEIKRPESWGGYILKPKYYEFWQGRENRLHDRIIFCLDQNNKWNISRLAP
jgi:pyridoxamine 5'-phosphate oxidase